MAVKQDKWITCDPSIKEQIRVKVRLLTFN